MRRLLILASLLTVVCLLGTGSAQTPRAVGGPDKGDYLYITQDAPGGPVYDFVDIAGTPGAQVPVMENCGTWTGNDASKPIPLGFEFTFYGRPYSTLRAASGGNLLFGPKVTEDCQSWMKDAGIANTLNSWMPSTMAPNQQIAAAWSAFGRTPGDPLSGLWYKTMGTPGDQVFIVQWNNVQHCAASSYSNFLCTACCAPTLNHGASNTFQVKLFEKRSVIEVHHKSHARAWGSWATNTGCMIQGIEGTGQPSGRSWFGLAYANAGVGTFCSSVSYMPPANWAIRYVRDMPPVAAFENYSVPPNTYHNGRVSDDDQPIPSPEPAYFHPGDLVLFQDRSTDDDGPIVNWTWTVTEPDLGIQKFYGKDLRYVFHNQSAQSYPVSLTVSDGYISRSVSKLVNVEPNEPPTIAFKVPDQGMAGKAAQFRDISTDVDGKVDTWYWDFGDNTVSTQQNPAHVYAKAGVYEVTYRAADDDGEESTIKARVTIAPNDGFDDATLLDPPIADAGPDQRVLPGATVDLFGYQTNGNPEVYRWVQTTGESVQLTEGASARPSFTAPQLELGADGRPVPKVLTFELTLTEQGRTSEPDGITITVAPLNAPPVLRVSAPQSARSGEVVALGAAASDPEGSPVSVHWTQVAGPAVALEDAGREDASFTAPAVEAPVDLVFEAMASDGLATDTVSVVVSVVPGEQLFTVVHRGAGEVAFIPAMPGQAYSWDFGDGATSADRAPTHTYAADGVYKVRLVVVDLDGVSWDASQDVTVQRIDAAPPVPAEGGRNVPGVAALALAGLVIAAAALRRR